MKIHIEQLKGNVLAYLTAKVVGWPLEVYFTESGSPIYRDEAPNPTWDPVNNWEQAGEIIDGFNISTSFDPARKKWWATCQDSTNDDSIGFDGETSREAAMIAYVMEKLFKMVDTEPDCEYPYVDEIEVSDKLSELFEDVAEVA